jgi:hypothetical protein
MSGALYFSKAISVTSADSQQVSFVRRTENYSICADSLAALKCNEINFNFGVVILRKGSMVKKKTCGKSTLLKYPGFVGYPSGGQYWPGEPEVAKYSEHHSPTPTFMS